MGRSVDKFSRFLQQDDQFVYSGSYGQTVEFDGLSVHSFEEAKSPLDFVEHLEGMNKVNSLMEAQSLMNLKSDYTSLWLSFLSSASQIKKKVPTPNSEADGCKGDPFQMPRTPVGKKLVKVNNGQRNLKGYEYAIDNRYKCRGCGGCGHSAAQCKWQWFGPSDGSVLCDICSKPHWSHDCPDKSGLRAPSSSSTSGREDKSRQDATK